MRLCCSLPVKNDFIVVYLSMSLLTSSEKMDGTFDCLPPIHLVLVIIWVEINDKVAQIVEYFS